MTKRMKVSAAGLLEVAELEGIVIAPYYCSAGVLTWGVGHTAAAGGPDPAQMNMRPPTSEEEIDGVVFQALRQFKIDSEKYAARVNEAVAVDVPQHQFDAMFSFDLNTGGIYRARLTRLLNGGSSVEQVADAFMGWLKPPEIRTRRKREARLFLDGDYDSNGDEIPVWTTNGNGKLTKVIKVISSKELLAMMGEADSGPVKKRISVPAEKQRSNPAKTKTVQAQVMQWLATGGAGFFAFWNSADDFTRYTILGLAAFAMLAGLVVFKDRLKAFANGWR